MIANTYRSANHLALFNSAGPAATYYTWSSKKVAPLGDPVAQKARRAETKWFGYVGSAPNRVFLGLSAQNPERFDSTPVFWLTHSRSSSRSEWWRRRHISVPLALAWSSSSTSCLSGSGYHFEKPHRGVGRDNTVLNEKSVPQTKGRIRCKSELGGILRSYYRDAA